MNFNLTNARLWKGTKHIFRQPSQQCLIKMEDKTNKNSYGAHFEVLINKATESLEQNHKKAVKEDLIELM